eukprot:CAMPEP_0201949084 /NCGR_PEP_ID=MMETSP0903-20130614/55794_1 /ASSEMBLY_ACC=CAM_ASM_000552 /TAXON_ID=420261 /ORGANISM="Thalassiosira antarctica, Strain CCMP982" /LENGTH=127 /DNA_ID=CAMNT_0048492283 /DNA_START=316 /DNA_END=699 /DNA_ORIENTATION=-
MRFYETMGMRFLVSDANVLRGDDVVGRAYIDSDRIAEMMRTGEPGLLSLGENIGIMKIVVTRGDDVVGRAYIDSDRIAEMMRTGEPGLLSLGENIGIMKIVVTLPPSDLKEKGALPFTSKVKRLDMP